MTCFAYETMFWQCTTKEHMKSYFKADLLVITHMVGGICDSSQRNVVRLNLITSCD